MKRFAAIVTIACLVVVMTTGSAFARSCNGCGCSDLAGAAAPGCSTGFTSACDMGAEQTMRSSDCGHETTARSQEVVSPEKSHPHAAAVAGPVVLRPVLLLGRIFGSLHAPDARGAPHMSAVMRN